LVPDIGGADFDGGVLGQHARLGDELSGQRIQNDVDAPAARAHELIAKSSVRESIRWRMHMACKKGHFRRLAVAKTSAPAAWAS
jgi:hypothetical protein